MLTATRLQVYYTNYITKKYAAALIGFVSFPRSKKVSFLVAFLRLSHLVFPAIRVYSKRYVGFNCSPSLLLVPLLSHGRFILELAGSIADVVRKHFDRF